jgi:hypothetical protein
MRRLPTALFALAAITPFAAPAFAHHSIAMFDQSKEILIEGTVARFDWVNPHMYLVVETKGPDGKPALVEGEGLGITQALVDGLDRNALKPGTPVVMRANPKRGGWGKQVRILDVTTQDGEVHPFYAANTRTRTLTPATSLEGHWAPNRAGIGAGFGAMARWPVTPEGRAAQQKLTADGLCFVEPIPFLAVLDELRTIEIGKDQVVMRFDNTGDHVERVIHMTAAHQPTFNRFARTSIGGGTADVVLTRSLQAVRSRRQRAVDPEQTHDRRLTLIPDRTRLRYEVTVNPVYRGTGNVVGHPVGPPPRPRLLAGPQAATRRSDPLQDSVPK